jgi:hypothetical protein
LLLDSQEKLSVFVAANDGREIKAAQVFTGKPWFVVLISVVNQV